jgi:trimeric autotransporter adhesin
VGNNLYFVPLNSSSVWKSDGTAAGTNVFFASDRIGNQPAMSMLNVGGELFFVADDDYHGNELWRGDGTVSGTQLIADIADRTNGSSYPLGFANVAGVLYFTADDGLNGYASWRSVGTSAGTVRLDSTTWPVSQGLSFLSNADGLYYFGKATSDTTFEIWAGDGSQAGTQFVTTIVHPRRLGTIASIAVGTSLYIKIPIGKGHVLWRTDGTAPGTLQLIEISNTSGTARIDQLFAGDGELYFSANDGVTGMELWRSDGTTAGTQLLKDISPGSASSGFSELLVVNNITYFSGGSGLNSGLWITDGTAAGTVLLKNNAGGSLANLNGVLYLTAADALGGVELWKSDGTVTGTLLVRDINPTGSGVYGKLVVVGNQLYFLGNEGMTGLELWKSDGTFSGTQLVADLNASLIQDLTNAAGVLYFTADLAGSGRELWRSDGTAGGTQLVADLAPGAADSDPGDFFLVGEKFFFIATSFEYGRELWVIDLNPALPGDYNRDNTVTAADHTFWQTNFNATISPGLQADGNGDGVVDAADYSIWRDHYTPPPASVAVASSAVSVGPVAIPTPIAASPARRAALTETAAVSTSQSNRTSELLAARDAAFAELDRASYEEVRASRRVTNSRGPTVRGVPGKSVSLAFADAERCGA